MFPFLPEDHPAGPLPELARPETPPQTWVHLECNTVVLFLLQVKLAQDYWMSRQK
jgi:hypothetical protein